MMCGCCGENEGEPILAEFVKASDYLRVEPKDDKPCVGVPLCLGCAASNPRVLCVFCRLTVKRRLGAEAVTMDGPSYETDDGRTCE